MKSDFQCSNCVDSRCDAEAKSARPLSFTSVLLIVFLVDTLLAGQSINLSGKHVTVTGNSVAQFQGGFQLLEFPLLNPANVVIRGQNSYTCAMV